MTAQLREYQGGAVPTQLGSAITAVSTVLTINATGGWPTGTPGPFSIVIDPSTATEEHVQCSLRSGGTLTVLNRGWDGTTAVGHAAGAVVKHIWGGDDATTVNKHAADPTQDDHTQYMHIATARTVSAVHTFTNSLVSLGTVSYFGPGGTGGTGPYLAIGNFGQAGAALVIASGTPADVALKLQTKGNGSWIFQNASGVQKLIIGSNGALTSLGSGSFGTGAIGGASGTYITIGDFGDPSGVYMVAQGTATNVAAVIRSQGTGTIRFQKGSLGSGVDCVVINTDALLTSSDAGLELFNGDLGIDNGLLRLAASAVAASTATGGGTGPPPTNTAGYVKIKIDGTTYKLPFYNN